MNITEAHETVRLLRHLDGSQSSTTFAQAAAVYLAARASQALQVEVAPEAQRIDGPLGRQTISKGKCFS